MQNNSCTLVVLKIKTVQHPGCWLVKSRSCPCLKTASFLLEARGSSLRLKGLFSLAHSPLESTFGAGALQGSELIDGEGVQPHHRRGVAVAMAAPALLRTWWWEEAALQGYHGDKGADEKRGGGEKRSDHRGPPGSPFLTHVGLMSPGLSV